MVEKLNRSRYHGRFHVYLYLYLSYLLNIVKVTPGPGIPRAAHDSAMVPAAARPLPLVPCKSWSHEHAALWNGS